MIQSSPSPTSSSPPAQRPIVHTTQVQYRAVVKTLYRWSARKRFGEDPDTLDAAAAILPAEIVRDLMARTDLSPKGLTSYRAALLWIFRQESQDNPVIAEAVSILVDWKPPVGRRTSTRARTIAEQDFEILADYLMGAGLRQHGRKSHWAVRAAYWLHAGLTTGLRPIEWLHARAVDDRYSAIKVLNAKQHLAPPAFLPHDPSGIPFPTDATRTIPIRQGSRLAVELHMKTLRAFVHPDDSPDDQSKDFAAYYNKCRIAIYRACGHLWNEPGRYTLYTMRGQFQSNMKASLGLAAAAELMGHSSVESPSAAHYGRSNKAHAAFKNKDKPALSPQLDQLLARKNAAAQEEGAGPELDG